MGKDKNAGIYVEVHAGEDAVVALDKALKKLKRKIKKSNLMVELFNTQFFRKPSDIKREKRMKAKARSHYRAMEEKEKDAMR